MDIQVGHVPLKPPLTVGIRDNTLWNDSLSSISIKGEIVVLLRNKE